MSKTPRKILITGISRGLGHGFARHFLREGETVYGISRGKPGDLLELFPERLNFREIDLADELHSPKPFMELIEAEASFDLVILNAGILGEIGDMRETGTSSMKHIMEVNLWSNKWILDCVFSNKREVRQIVAISSGASISGSRGWNGYSLSKAALNMMIKLYAGEIPQTHFCAFAPGLIDTAMQAYISGLPEDERFSTVSRLKMARGTESMPDPDKAAADLIAEFPKLLKYPSGSFVDVRKM